MQTRQQTVIDRLVGFWVSSRFLDSWSPVTWKSHIRATEDSSDHKQRSDSRFIMHATLISEDNCWKMMSSETGGQKLDRQNSYEEMKHAVLTDSLGNFGYLRILSRGVIKFNIFGQFQLLPKANRGWHPVLDLLALKPLPTVDPFSDGDSCLCLGCDLSKGLCGVTGPSRCLLPYLDTQTP